MGLTDGVSSRIGGHDMHWRSLITRHLFKDLNMYKQINKRAMALGTREQQW